MLIGQYSSNSTLVRGMNCLSGIMIPASKQASKQASKPLLLNNKGLLQSAPGKTRGIFFYSFSNFSKQLLTAKSGYGFTWSFFSQRERESFQFTLYSRFFRLSDQTGNSVVEGFSCKKNAAKGSKNLKGLKK